MNALSVLTVPVLNIASQEPLTCRVNRHNNAFMTLNPSHSILIQVKSQPEADRIVGLLRDSLKNIRAHRITSENDLLDHLKEADQWHLLISDNLHPEVSLPYALEAIDQQAVDLPVVLLASEMSDASRQQLIGMGISDIIDKARDWLFVHAARREMQNTLARRSAKHLQTELEALQKRADQLMSETDEAIAYVADGILIDSNKTFADAFGYDDIDELECASLIDLVSDSDQDTFKHFLRAFAKGDIDHNSLTFNALKANDETFSAQIQLSQTALDGEPCIQINLQTAAAADAQTQAIAEDSATALPNRYALSEQLSLSALQHANKATLAVFSVDDFALHQSELLVSGTDLLMKDLAEQITQQLPMETLARIGDGMLGGISLQSPDALLEACEPFLKALDNHISDIDGRSVQYSCSISLQKLTNIDASKMLDNMVAGLCQLRESQPKSTAAIFSPQEKKPTPQDVSSADSFEDIIEAGAVRIMYQPIMSLHGDEMENYEVSIDSEDPALIDSLDKSKLDRWLLLESTKALAAHYNSGHKTRLIINLTQAGLLDEGLPSWLKVALKAANLPQGSVVLQFDEVDVKNHLKQAMANFATFKSQNGQVSINRFGSGQEPEKLLKHLNPDFLRFDPKYTELLTSGGDTGDLKEIMTQVNEQGIKTVLPEVQNASVLASSWQLGTHYIQGSYLQVPTPEMNYEFTELT